MVTIRLRRAGQRKQPSYRLVVCDSRSPAMASSSKLSNSTIRCATPRLEVKADRVRHWLSIGARPSETVARLLKRVDVLDANGKAHASRQLESTFMRALLEYMVRDTG
jgi:small subunit ribosomal protein S16